MIETILDSLPVAQLPDRYGIARSVLYIRLSDLRIKPEKRGNKAYVNADQLKLLDDAHEAIRAGISMAEFLDSRRLSDRQGGHSIRQSASAIVPLANVDPSAAILIERGFANAVLETLVDRLTPQSDPLANLELLEKACSHGWLLSTSQLASLLGLKSLNGKEVYRYGFTFTRVGKNGAESAWLITKLKNVVKSNANT